MSRFAAAREDGLKPYVVTPAMPILRDALVHAKNTDDARQRYRWLTSHPVAQVRRATPEDMAAHPERTE